MPRFNRYIVECKDVIKYQTFQGQKDLIDTLWNVKYMFYDSVETGEYGFNRYIVECKGQEAENASEDVQDLIDTLWNVKKQ